MKTAPVVIIAIVIMSMFMISDAGPCKKKFVKFQKEIKKLTSKVKSLKKVTTNQNKELKKLREQNKNLTSAIESLKNETENQVEAGLGLEESSILGSVDNKYLDQLVSYLQPVLQSSANSSFKRCWNGNTDGWAASTFHSNCDGKGPSVTIVKVGDYIFGGYSDMAWDSSCIYAKSSKAFIFSLYNVNGYAPVKRETKADGHSVYGCIGFGPTFGGGHDLHISDNAASNTASYTYCGESYPLPEGYSSSFTSCTFYAGSYRFTPTDVEVFYETTT